eukprot:gene4520-8977_t
MYKIVVTLSCFLVFTDSYTREDFKDCLISQFGKDGFGHQLEGKLSCIITDWFSKRMSYVHIPFGSMEHGTIGEYAEIFSGLGSGSVMAKDLPFPYSIETVSPEWIANVNKNELIKCNKSVIYTPDNCWELIYYPPIVSQLNGVKSKLQEKYLSTPKPDINFKLDTINIAIHIRSRERDRRFSVDFYKRAIKFYSEMYSGKSPIFWISADDPNWHGVKELRHSIPTAQQGVRGKNESLFTDFHRMVMADGLVMSHSSLSAAAALLSNATKIVGFSPGSRGTWFEASDRFVTFPRNL